jgi:predicted protein tyrosine phosphatase
MDLQNFRCAAAYPRHVIENGTLPESQHIVISITDLKSDEANIPVNAGTLGVLRLAFPDRDRGPDLFSVEQAKQVWDFVKSHTEAEIIIVHCTMGMSRSPGIAAAISKVVTGDDASFFKKHTPNMHVFRTMLEVYYEHYEGQDNPDSAN